MIIYSKKTAAIYYDPDGDGSGDHVKTAITSKDLQMTQSFLVI
ncbi:hypothetical protein [Microvirga ossetica]|nr:hypothetical protein [Microvirga ossetica]